MAVKQAKGSLEIPVKEFMEFAMHFHITPDLMSSASFDSFIRSNLGVEALKEDRGVLLGGIVCCHLGKWRRV